MFEYIPSQEVIKTQFNMAFGDELTALWQSIIDYRDGIDLDNLKGQSEAFIITHISKKTLTYAKPLQSKFQDIVKKYTGVTVSEVNWGGPFAMDFKPKNVTMEKSLDYLKKK